MRDTILSPLIRIDEAATENEHLLVHFVTRPLAIWHTLPNRSWSGVVYTSGFIKKVLINVWNKWTRDEKSNQTIRGVAAANHPPRVIAMEPYHRYTIPLSDGSELLAVLLPTESAACNVMLLLELNDRRIFYTGDFIEYESVLRSSWLQTDFGRLSQSMSDNTAGHIDVAYVDNRSTGETLSLPAACEAIRTICDRHVGHRLRLPLPAVGYEDLLAALASPPYSYRIKCGALRSHILSRKRQPIAGANLTDDQMAARIVVVVEQPVTPDEYRRFRRWRIVTVRLVDRLPTEDAMAAVGATTSAAAAAVPIAGTRYHAAWAMYEVAYVPHADPADVLELAEHLQATRVRGLYASVKYENYNDGHDGDGDDDDDDDDDGDDDDDASDVDEMPLLHERSSYAAMHSLPDEERLQAVLGDFFDEYDRDVRVPLGEKRMVNRAEQPQLAHSLVDRDRTRSSCATSASTWLNECDSSFGRSMATSLGDGSVGVAENATKRNIDGSVDGQMVKRKPGRPPKKSMNCKPMPRVVLRNRPRVIYDEEEDF